MHLKKARAFAEKGDEIMMKYNIKKARSHAEDIGEDISDKISKIRLKNSLDFHENQMMKNRMRQHLQK